MPEFITNYLKHGFLIWVEYENVPEKINKQFFEIKHTVKSVSAVFINNYYEIDKYFSV